MEIDNKMLGKIEKIINDFGAELTAQKIILQLLVAHMVVVVPMLAEEALEQLKDDVIAALKRPPHLSNQNEDKRVVELQVQHGERFFHELAAAVSVMRNKAGQSGHH
jgi:cell division septation protein DedD